MPIRLKESVDSRCRVIFTFQYFSVAQIAVKMGGREQVTLPQYRCIPRRNVAISLCAASIRRLAECYRDAPECCGKQCALVSRLTSTGVHKPAGNAPAWPQFDPFWPSRFNFHTHPGANRRYVVTGNCRGGQSDFRAPSAANPLIGPIRLSTIPRWNFAPVACVSLKGSTPGL
jgi:hypothetical protein